MIIDSATEREKEIIREKQIPLVAKLDDEDEFSCPISFSMMVDPVRICDGRGNVLFQHTFDRTSIENALNRKLENPLTRQDIPYDYRLVTNFETIGKMIQHFDSEYKPIINQLLEANCQVTAYSLLQTIDKKIVGEMSKSGNEEQKKLAEEFTKYQQEKLEELTKLTRNSLSSSSAEALLKHSHEITTS